MKVNFEHAFVDHKNIPIKNGDAQAKLKDVSIDSLMYLSAQDEKIPAQEKIKRHDLGVKILNFGNEAELSVEDVALLKKLIGERYIPAVVAQAYAVLEGKELPKYC